MAKLRTVTYVDDVTGEETPTAWLCVLEVDGAVVELPLGDASRDRLLAALEPFLHAQGPVHCPCST
ncbi:Lsr2 family protein [Actinacidiphila guanduensis]|uniref:Lsr2 protein n=1 Tax=Actinacidiphila guanduensis TaxID=310781 RepID=A0A1H0SDI3_9ACTN|nr:Lsr2 family protein [Actinacidiphila guanduensis]SDP39288.1 Lsr2 protein [Actinacidiphila guanduensis]